MGDDNFRLPTESTPLDRSHKNLLLLITSVTLTAVPNLMHIRPLGALGQMGEFFYLFINTENCSLSIVLTACQEGGSTTLTVRVRYIIKAPLV